MVNIFLFTRIFHGILIPLIITQWTRMPYVVFSRSTRMNNLFPREFLSAFQAPGAIFRRQIRPILTYLPDHSPIHYSFDWLLWQVYYYPCLPNGREKQDSWYLCGSGISLRLSGFYLSIWLSRTCFCWQIPRFSSPSSSMLAFPPSCLPLLLSLAIALPISCPSFWFWRF